MARKIEHALAAAVSSNLSWRASNTSYCAQSRAVALHGSIIARRAPDGRWQYNLCGWNTVTTRSRLRALGAPIYTRQGVPFIGANELPPKGWFDAQGATIAD